MKPGSITLIPFGFFGEELLDQIPGDLEKEFLIPVNTKESFLDLSEYYDAARNQYNGNRILKEIDTIFATDDSKTIALFDVDLFIPILTFIFGQAYMNGRCGIVSVFRLRNERYGIRADEQVFHDRIRKEVIHELGHTFGLIHCPNPVCVMRPGTYVEDIDQKSHHFCPECKREIVI